MTPRPAIATAPRPQLAAADERNAALEALIEDGDARLERMLPPPPDRAAGESGAR